MSENPLIRLEMDADGAWTDMAGKKVMRTTGLRMGVLPHGMQSGAPSVAIRIDLPDGQIVIAETSLALLVTTVNSIRARFDSGEAGYGIIMHPVQGG